METPKTQGQPESDAALAPAQCSAPITAVAKEIFEVFVRHRLSYEQCISVMAATTKMIGRKAAKNEVGAFCMFLDKALKICPELIDVAKDKEPNAPGERPGAQNRKLL